MKSNTKKQKREMKCELKCIHCSKEFKYESEKKRHEQSHSPQFACKVCGKKFSFMSALRRHEKQHERTGSVNCEECSRKFRDKALLKRHIEYAHKGEFTCSNCDATFSSHLALQSHMKSHKPESERRFRCSFSGCLKKFNFAHHLKHHELTHTNTKQHFCNTCGKGFIQYHHLKSHMKIHEPETWLPCSFPNCKKTFSTMYALKRHLGTHKNGWNENTNTDVRLYKKTVYSDSEENETMILPEINSSSDISCKPYNLVLKEDKFIQSEAFSEQERRSVIFRIDNSKSAFNLEKPLFNETNDKVPVNFVSGNYISENSYGEINCTVQSNDIQSSPFSASHKPEIKDDKVTKKSACEGCECGKSFETNSNSLKAKKRNSLVSSKVDDIVECRPDGTIKIKESQFMDIELKPTKNDKQVEVKVVDEKVVRENVVPFNSCKAFLGTCIVSGNGTIDDSCLCAKMAIDEQQMLEQQIDELTPRPLTY